MKTNNDWALHIKSMAQINGKEVFADIKLPKKRKPRAKETKPRQQPEREFRKIVLKHLRKRFFKIWRIENSLPGYRGLPDLFVMSKITNSWSFIELKAPGCKLRDDEQLEFRRLCLKNGINHIVANCLEDLNPILWRAE